MVTDVRIGSVRNKTHQNNTRILHTKVLWDAFEHVEDVRYITFIAKGSIRLRNSFKFVRI